MPKILIVDTYYPQFLESLPFDPNSSYEVELRKVLDRSFGTADFYSNNLRALGWQAVDLIANHDGLQELYARERRSYDPDVIFMQDLSIEPPVSTEGRILVGQCSCPMPPEQNLRRYDVIFSSFPHYIDRFERMGIKAVYNPLAFDPIVIERAGGPVTERPYDCVFIGGVGDPSHWRQGMQTLEAIASEIPTFKWWGYGVDTLPRQSALRDKYQGEAWGLDMYRILLSSKIVINRHGEVAQGYANNMRMFEATGCGAMLVTERAPNLSNFFTGNEAVAYDSPLHAAALIRRYLENNNDREFIAEQGQKRTLRDHTYNQRMKTASETLKAML